MYVLTSGHNLAKHWLYFIIHHTPQRQIRLSYRRFVLPLRRQSALLLFTKTEDDLVVRIFNARKAKNELATKFLVAATKV